MTKRVNEFRLGLSYDDVLLIPTYSTIASRKNVSTSTLLSKNILLEIPIISANMDTVTESEMAIAMSNLGGIGIIHRFMTAEKQAQNIRETLETNRPRVVGGAIGVSEGEIERAKKLIDAGVSALVLDVAHGHHARVIHTIKQLKHLYPNTEIIAGNVATENGAYALIEAGADAIKVGVGPGAGCSTRIVTGIGVPQLTALLNCAEVCHRHNIPMIADGGIKNSGDITKALAAGASSVMLGNLLAGTLESPGEVINGKYKFFRGMASKGAAELRRSLDGSGNYNATGAIESHSKASQTPEGIEGHVRYKGSVQGIVEDLLGGLRSGMSYLNATAIEELYLNAEFIRITPAGMRESAPHDVIIQGVSNEIKSSFSN